jgi:1-phosphofructokinase
MSHAVMVFAPAPMLTVTIEPHGDAPDIHLHAGGQGIWQARMISTLSVDVVVCAALGGETGRVLEALMVGEEMRLRVVTTGTANVAYVHDRRDGDRRELARSVASPLTRHEVDELYGMTFAEGLGARVCLLSGTPTPPVVAPEVYRRLAGDLRRNGGSVVADLAGDYLTEALAGGLSLVKVAHDELIECGRVADDDEKGLVKALHAMHEEGAESVVISRGERPALALLDGSAYRVIAPTLEPADTRGAGDSMTAGAVAVLARGGDAATAVRTGAAAGAVNVTRHGLGTGEAGVIAQVLERVTLERLSSSAGTPSR